jgi:hypothetical protein
MVPSVHAAAEGPAHLELPDGLVLKPDEGDGGVLGGYGVDHRVGQTHHFDRPDALADEAADDLDAVAGQVDDGPAAGQFLVPKPGAVRPGMGLPRPDPEDLAECSPLDRSDRLQSFRRIDQVLKIAGEHTGLVHDLHDLQGFAGAAG